MYYSPAPPPTPFIMGCSELSLLHEIKEDRLKITLVHAQLYIRVKYFINSCISLVSLLIHIFRIFRI